MIKSEFLRHFILFWVGIWVGFFVLGLFQSARADVENIVFPLGAIVSGCVAILAGSLIIPAGYEPGKLHMPARMLQAGCAFIGVMALIIIARLFNLDASLLPIAAPAPGLAGYVAGNALAKRILAD